MTNVLTRSNDASRSGHNASEHVFTSASVGTRGIRRLFSLDMQGDPRGSEGQPLIAEVKLSDGRKQTVCYAADMAGNVYAWDVSAAQPVRLWKKAVATPVVGTRAIDSWNINVNWCFLSTPVIDIEVGAIYLCSWSSPDGSVDKASFHVHALSLVDGHALMQPLSLEGVVYAPAGLPVQRFNSAARKQRSGLTLSKVKSAEGVVHKVLWVACGSVKETGPQARGWVIAIDLASKKMCGWTSAVKHNGGGIWQGAQGLTVDPKTGDCLGMTGNGAFDGITEFGECFFRLRYSPDRGRVPASIACVDHWSPFSDTGRSGADPTLVDDSLIPNQGLQGANAEAEEGPTNPAHTINPSNFNSFLDQDLGSGGPLLLDDLGLLLGAGKDGIAYVLNASRMGKTKPSDFAPDKISANYAKLKSPPIWFTYFPGFGVTAAPTRLTDLDTLFEGKTHHQHSTPVHLKLASGHRLFTWGENGNLRAWTIDASGVLRYLACSAEVASPQAPGPNSNPPGAGGMPGGMLSGSSNEGAGGTALIWALVPYGDANREISAGRFLVYDAETFARFPDGSGQIRVLWDSERWGLTFHFNKFNVPTVANGKVYVPTYDSRIDVYGLA
ncbi:MAG: hypothetical protein ABIV63_10255 [Caldimonas sp.]